MLTLNQIKTKLISFFEGHAQINDVKYMDDFDFNAERNLTYPVCNIEFLNPTINEKSLNYNFKIVLADMVDANYPDQVDDVLNDVILIAEDFFSYLQEEEGWVFNRSISINKFLDDGGDRVSGIVFTVSLTVIRSQNTCIKPVKELE